MWNCRFVESSSSRQLTSRQSANQIWDPTRRILVRIWLQSMTSMMLHFFFFHLQILLCREGNEVKFCLFSITQDFLCVLCNRKSANKQKNLINIKIWDGELINLCLPCVWQACCTCIFDKVHKDWKITSIQFSVLTKTWAENARNRPLTSPTFPAVQIVTTKVCYISHVPLTLNPWLFSVSYYLPEKWAQVKNWWPFFITGL